MSEVARDVALDVEVAMVEDLVPDPENVRRHSARNVEAVAASLERFGQRKPIVVHRGVVIAGNATLAAAISLGWDRLATVALPEDWTEAEAKAFAIADNRTSDLATWDYEDLVASLGGIADEDLVRAAGFTPDEMDDLVARLQEGATDDPTGMRSTPSLGDYADRYADRATRLLVCELPNATYVWLTDRLRDLRAEWELTSNADAIVALVRERFGDPSDSAPGSGAGRVTLDLGEYRVERIERVVGHDEFGDAMRANPDGLTVGDVEPNVDDAVLYVDAGSGEPVLANLPLPGGVADLRRAVSRIRFGETVRQSTGKRNKSRTFGMSPRKCTRSGSRAGRLRSPPTSPPSTRSSSTSRSGSAR